MICGENMKPDEAHVWTDEQLAALEKRIAAVYKEAADELSDKIKAYFESFKKRDDEQLALLQEGKITRQQYMQWRLAQIGRGERFEALRDRVVERSQKSWDVANAYIFDATPGIYTLNRNYIAYTIEKQVGSDIGFDLWDEQAVKRLIVEKPDIMPYYSEVLAWRRGFDVKKGKLAITEAITSSLLMGNSIPHIADEMQKKLPNMSRVSSVRTARTAVTGAQNAGRQESFDAAAQMGIELEKQWLATLDSRTRHDHAAADGQTVGEKDPFNIGGYDMMYPGDPSGPAHEVYNCRCTMIAVVKYVPLSLVRRAGNTIIPNMTYKEWEKRKAA